MQGFFADEPPQVLRGNKQRNRGSSFLSHGRPKSTKKLSSYMIRQIAIVRQMVYNMLSIFDVTKNLAMRSTSITSLISFCSNTSCTQKYGHTMQLACFGFDGV